QNPWHNGDIDAVSRAIVVENKWRAQRYGVHGTFVTGAGAVTVGEMLERVIAETAKNADALGCAQEAQTGRNNVVGGTSADPQLAVFEANKCGKNRDNALRAVTDWIASATLQ